MRSVKVAVFGCVIGGGLGIAVAVSGAATASATPADSGRGAVHSSVSSHAPPSTAATGHSSRRSATANRRHTRADAQPPGTDTAASPVVALEVRSPAATVTKPAVSATPARVAVARATPGLPTLDDVRRVVVAAIDGVRRNLDAARRTIEVSVQLHVDALRRELTRIFGGSTTPPTPPAPPNLPADTDVVYGDVKTNFKYWVGQSAETSALTSVTMVIGQLTGSMPTLAQIIREAETTASVVREKRPIYLGPLVDDWVWYRDGMQLLKNHGITTTGYYYQSDQGDVALNAVEVALGQGKAVIVQMHSEAVRRYFLGEVRSDTEHQVVVLGIDATTGVVYLNDGALPDGGQTLTMSVSDFLNAWKVDSYGTVIAELAPTAQSASATTTTLTA